MFSCALDLSISYESNKLSADKILPTWRNVSAKLKNFQFIEEMHSKIESCLQFQIYWIPSSSAFTCHDHGATVLQYAPKHQLLISGGRKGYICIFDIRQRQTLFTFQAHESAVKALALDPSEDYFVTGSAEGNMKVRLDKGAGLCRRVFGWSSALSYVNSQINPVTKPKQTPKPTLDVQPACFTFIMETEICWQTYKASRFCLPLKNSLLRLWDWF